jgi:hypothetical protein
VIKAASIAERSYEYHFFFAMMAAFITPMKHQRKHFIVYIYILSIFKKYELDSDLRVEISYF